MKYALCLTALLLSAGYTSADERIHSATIPAWCKGQQSSGACIRGPKDYELVNGQVRWVDTQNANDPRFWQRADRDKFGTTDTSGK